MNSFGQTVFSGNDYWKLLTKAGLNVSNEYTAAVFFGKSPINNFDEFYRSFRPDMRVWGFIGYFYTRGMTAFAPWWFALNRYGGFTWYAATPWGYNLVDTPTGALTVWGKDLKEVLEANRNRQRRMSRSVLSHPHPFRAVSADRTCSSTDGWSR